MSLSFVEANDDEYAGGWTLVTYGRKRRSNRARAPEEVREMQEREAAEGQDWTRVVLKSSGPRRSAPTERRGDGGEGQRLRKLEQATTAGKRKVLSEITRRQIASYRVGVGWSQDELNRQCQFPVNTIREIESGRLVPNPRQLNQLNATIKMNLSYTWTDAPVKKEEY